MASKRAHIILPEEMIEEIDHIVGRRGRSGFIVRATAAELKRLRQLEAVRKAAGSWKDQDHPELGSGAGRWVARLREENERTLPKIRRR